VSDPAEPPADLSRRETLLAAGALLLTAGSAGAASRRAFGTDDALLDASVTELAKAIRSRRVSSEEMVRAFLARIGEVNERLNAVVQLRADQALAEARAADSGLARRRTPGPLHGVPMTVKDSLDTGGLITTAGIKGRETHVPAHDATVVARLRAAGAILLGKTNTPELTLSFETTNAVYGRTNNPYDLNLTPGGSSGGAAAILASSGSPLDVGSDTGGSIRLPAHFCGVAGLKPTAGRVPRTGHIISWDGPTQSLTQIGPLARYVADLRLVLPIIAGADGVDPAMQPVALRDATRVRLRDLRVAFFSDNGIAPPTAETAKAVSTAVQALRDDGARTAEARPPPIGETFDLYMQLIRADGGAGLRRLLNKLGVTESMFLRGSGKGLSVEEYTAILARWDDFRSRMSAFWSDHEALICPVNAHPAIAHGAMGQGAGFKAYSYTMTDNLTGWPAAVVRCGTSAEGLPIGVQVVAPPWREDICLAVAERLEARLGGWRRAAI
jgi:amidase